MRNEENLQQISEITPVWSDITYQYHTSGQTPNPILENWRQKSSILCRDFSNKNSV